MKQQVIIIRGPSGAGKSSVAHLLTEILRKKIKRLAYLPIDVSIYPFVRSHAKLSGKERADIMQENIELLLENFLKRKFIVVIDGMFDRKHKGKSAMDRLIKITKKYKVKTIVFELHAHLETVLERTEERGKTNPHNWRDPKKTKERHKRFMKTLHKDAIVIHTEKKSQKEVVEEILKVLK